MMSEKRTKLLSSFTVEDLDNQITLASITQALQILDIEEIMKPVWKVFDMN